jgi:purine-binding chemotaxis protein CheW
MAQTRSTLVTFELGEVRLAVDAARVREVVRAVAVTPLPGAPDVVEGVIDLRGETIPVFDTRRRFGQQPRPVEPADHFVIVETGERTAALHVDATGWLLEVPADRITAASELTSGARHIAGTATLPDGIVAIHDVATFLSRAESELLDEALADQRDA